MRAVRDQPQGKVDWTSGTDRPFAIAAMALGRGMACVLGFLGEFEDFLRQLLSPPAAHAVVILLKGILPQQR